MLFGELIIWYLFLGGLGGGSYLAWFCVACAARRRPKVWLPFAQTLTAPLLVASLASTVVGCLCLLQDLKLPGRLLLLFTSPAPSLLNLGAFALAAFVVCLGILVVMSLRCDPLGVLVTARSTRLARFVRLQHGVAALAAVLALAIIIYTGVFLFSITAVPFWGTVLVPVIFALSSVSTGGALLIIVALLTTTSSQQCFGLLKTVLKIDLALIALEAGAFLLMCLLLWDNTIAQISLRALMQGAYLYEFWFGLVGCMVLIPCALELFLLVTRLRSAALYAFLAGAILVGGYFLRYCIVNAGVHFSKLMYTGFVLS